MPKAQFSIKNKGFSLIELLIATIVFSVFVLATVRVTISIHKNTFRVANSEQAVALAEEAMEVARNLRDANPGFMHLPDGTYGLSVNNNQWNLVGAFDVQGIFTRAVTISTVNASQKKIRTTISWFEQETQPHSVTVDTYLTDWLAPLSIGLTMSKTVINHGGTKVPDDFLPIELSTLAWDNAIDPPIQNFFNIPIIFSPDSMNLGPGVYTFSTSNDPSYSLNLSPDCNGNSVTLADGDTKLCNITYEQYVAPTVIAPTVTDIKANTAILGANVTSLGNPGSITARGTCWDTMPAPVANCLAEGGTVTGIFTQARAGFSPNTTYFYRGYATNATGTGYSADATFVTLAAAALPTVTTSTISNIAQTTATSGGNVTADGGSPVTARGVVWDLAANPTIALPTKTSDGVGMGLFTGGITGLTCNTLYHVRAYATNTIGTSYGSDLTFTTSPCSNVPTVDTPVVSNITSTSATLGATVQSLGIPATISARGVCYGTVANPSLTNGATCVVAPLSQAVPSAFTISASSLTPNTTYHYRGYATNATGTGYSANATFMPASTIMFVASAGATGTTASIPAHQVGDLLVAFAYRDGNNAPPTVPAGWTAIHTTGGANNNSSVLAYRIATGVEPASGWSNATEIIVQIYRGVAASPIGANAVQNGNTNTVIYPALPLNVPNGTSWVIGFGGDRAINTNIQIPPTGMTNRAIVLDKTAEVAGHDTNAGVSSWAAQSVSVGGRNNGWMTRVLEIKSK